MRIHVEIFNYGIWPVGIVVGDGGQSVMPCQTFVALIERMMGASIDGRIGRTHVKAKPVSILVVNLLLRSWYNNTTVLGNEAADTKQTQ